MDIPNMMDITDHIRNISFLNHGKSPLRDLLAAADEPPGTTIDSSGIPLHFYDMHNTNYLLHLNFMDSSSDFSPPEVSAALKSIDGAVVFAHYDKGLSLQMEALLRNAGGSRIKPVLTLETDLYFLGQLDGELAYQRFERVIKQVNSIIIMETVTNDDGLHGDCQVSPEKGTVSFSAGLQGWAFTLTSFAKCFHARFNLSEEEMMMRFYNKNVHCLCENSAIICNTDMYEASHPLKLYRYSRKKAKAQLTPDDTAGDVEKEFIKKVATNNAWEGRRNKDNLLMICVQQYRLLAQWPSKGLIGSLSPPFTTFDQIL